MVSKPPFSADELHAARLALGLSQTDFAAIGARFGVHVASDRRTVSYWEAGDRALPGALVVLVLVLLASVKARRFAGIAEARVDLTQLLPETRRRLLPA